MGDDEKLEEMVVETKEALDAIVSKPRVTTKLLKRAPFRFLHDLISNVIAATSFGEGLYNDEEMDAGNKDRAGKMGFLDKMITCVGHAHGSPIDCRSAKVVAGLEPINTNIFLQALARVASGGADSRDAVARTLNGDDIGAGLPGQGASAKAMAPAAEAKASKVIEPERDEPKAAPAPAPQVSESKRGSVSSNRDGSDSDDSKPQPTRGGGGGGGGGGFEADGTDLERTKTLLEQLFQKPRISTKHLGRPPFRFLHDVVCGVLNASEFATGLYTPEEMDASNISDRASKMAFLDKIINCVGIAADMHIPARSAKIVAGLEAADTNVFLQVFAQVCRTTSGSAAVKAVLAGDEQPGPGHVPGGSGGGGAAAPAPAPAPAAARAAEPAPAAQAKGETHDNEAMASAKGAGRDAEEGGKRAGTPEAKGAEGATEEAPAKRARPTTARRPPPKLKDNVQDVAPDLKQGTVAPGILVDGGDSDDDDDDDDDAGAAMAKPGAVDDGEQHSKMVQDILDKEKADEEAKRLQAEQEEEEKKKEGGGIRMGRLKKATKPGSREATQGKAFSEAELYELRRSIQLLCQSTNPLGKCMDYVHEDMEMMNKELDQWKGEYRRKTEELEVESRQTQESLQALQLQLVEVDEKVQEQVQKINSVKASISKNDVRIQQLLRMVVSV